MKKAVFNKLIHNLQAKAKGHGGYVLHDEVNGLIEDEFDITELDRIYERLSDLKIEIPRGSLITAPRLQVSSNLRDISVDPLVHSYALEIMPPDLKDLRSDFQRLADGLQGR